MSSMFRSALLWYVVISGQFVSFASDGSHFRLYRKSHSRDDIGLLKFQFEFRFFGLLLFRVYSTHVANFYFHRGLHGSDVYLRIATFVLSEILCRSLD